MQQKKVLLIVLIVIILLASFAAGIIFGPALFNERRGEDDPGEHNDPGGDPEEPGQGSNNPDQNGDAPGPDLADLVRAAAEKHRADPVDAVYNSAYNTVIPEMNGYRIDQQATLARLMAAAPGEAVAPVWQELRPAVTAADHPAAVIERGNPARQRVAFMINVAWGNEYLPEMLDILEQHDAQGTFFIVGRWAERFPDLLQEIHRRGHELANHGYDDGEVMPDLDYNATISSLRRTNEIIEKFTGQQPRYFSPHKGEYSSTTCRAAAALGMRLLVWTLDTVDWKRPGEEAMAQRILDNLSPGAIILMHPTEQSAGFLRLVIPQIKSRGYRIVSVKELLSPVPSFPQLTLKR